jgi:deferrochelatase/peroxidase EfeB
LASRSYNYDLGVDGNGQLQADHIFGAYQQDAQRQFETIQKRLLDEPLVDYVQPFGWRLLLHTAWDPARQ